MLHDSQNQPRLLAKVLRELLARERFDTLADLTAALKDRCSRLRLHVDGDAINGAYTLISSNTELVSAPRQEAELPETEPRAISQSEAVRMLRRLGVSVGDGRLAQVDVRVKTSADAPEYFPVLVEVPR